MTHPTGSIDDLMYFLKTHSNILVLTGAGVSTSSGIPAYRDASGQWLRRTPIFYQDFIRCPIARRRYWARSYFGWNTIAGSLPNEAHRGLADLQRKGFLGQLITQNVDGLHQRAQSESVIELHGQLGRVRCLDCDGLYDRDVIQEELKRLNQGFEAEIYATNPDGDVDLDEDAYPDFIVADCPKCRGRLKPDVVFFGESVPAPTNAQVVKALNDSSALLVVGSSLVVMSGYRLVRQAHQLGKPIVVINRGRTRADDLIRFKIEDDCSEVIQRMCSLLESSNNLALP
jgi:NAD-dependent SIR2 family protein deacetylase